MLKRLLSAVLALGLFFVFLCGCAGHRELDKGYMLTSVGFEGADGGFKVIAELLSVSDTQDSSPAPQVLSAIGETPESALYNLSLDFPRAVYFDHCATLVIGQGIETEKLKSVINYCAQAQNLNLNMYVIYSPDIEMLFKTPTVSAAVGYHIMRLLSFKAKESGVDYNSKFYEIKKNEGANNTAFSLPSFSGGEEIGLEGSIVYKNLEAVMSLNNTEGIAYAFLSGDFKNGRVSVGREYADIKRVKYSFSATPQDKAIETEITATISASNTTKGFFEALQSEIDALITRAEGEDIFNIKKRAAERGITSADQHQKTEIKYKVEKK